MQITYDSCCFQMHQFADSGEYSYQVIVIERDEEMKNAVILYIQRELGESGSMLGYRALWKILQQKYDVVVFRCVYLY